VAELDGWESSAVAFDATGRRLLVGGAFDRQGRPLAGARLWDGRAVPAVSRLRGAGPVAFAADGTPLQLTLSPDDRSTLLLWDVARQRPLQRFRLPGPAGERLTSNWPPLALSAGRRLVGAAAFDPDGNTTILVWDGGTGKVVRRALERGREVTALAFSPDGSWLACGDAGGGISLWPLAAKGPPVALPRSGRNLVNCLAFNPSGKRLLLLRGETASGLPPFGRWHYRDHPRLCVIRDLLGPSPLEPVAPPITFFNRRVLVSAAAPDANCFVVLGERDGPGGESQRGVRAFDGRTGQKLWGLANVDALREAPGGKLLTSTDDRSADLREMRSGSLLGRISPRPRCISPDSKTWATESGDGKGFTLFRRGSEALRVTLGGAETAFVNEFSPDGKLLAWGTAEGAVVVCDLPQVRRRLDAVGLAWDE
jgi:WD40 repeat protein